MDERTAQLGKLREKLRGRRLIWLGNRGEDAKPLLDLPEFSHCFSRFAPLADPALEVDESLETLSRLRINHNTYAPEADTSEAARALRDRLYEACDGPTVVLPYKPEVMLTTLSFVRDVQVLSPFHEHQTIFDYKPWVETELRKAGIRTLRWRYVGDQDPRRLEVLSDALRGGPLVLRVNRSRGGVGLRVAREPLDLPLEPSGDREGFTAFGPYLADGVPLNVSACVFADGTVTLHAPSLQLIGIPPCTAFPLGYCGNDFASAGTLDAAVLDEFEAITVAAGAWLHSKGYLGGFGIDGLVVGREVYLVEVNPRFQGSSALGARLSRELDASDIYIDHMAAHLGLDASTPRPLRELARMQRPVAQVYSYNSSGEPVSYNGIPIIDGCEVELLADMNVSVGLNATLFRTILEGPVTRDGVHLDLAAEDRVRDLNTLFKPSGPGPATKSRATVTGSE